jgi:hypothetical protein
MISSLPVSRFICAKSRSRSPGFDTSPWTLVTFLVPDLLYRRGQLRITAPGYENVRAFVHKLLRRDKTNAAIATGNECNFPFKFAHVLGCHLFIKG